MVPYEVQLIGGIQLHLGRIAEMATGEGKTLVATLPLYLNALPGRGAHLVTVNNYLARRDSQWMGHLYRWLGLTVGCLDDTEPGSWERREVYGCDITYGTNNEFGFDYLRDNMVTTLDQRVQRQHIFAMIDEVDSILVDEARTPLIISGPVGNDGDTQYAELQRGRGAAGPRAVRPRERAGRRRRARARGRRHRHGGAAVVQGAAGLARRTSGCMKALQEQGVKQLVQRMELDRIADRKLPAGKQQFRDLEDDLLFVLDEKGHTVHLTEQGLDWLSPDDRDAFVLPDIATLHRPARQGPRAERAASGSSAANAVEREYATKSERLNIIHQLLRAHALYEKDVNYVVQDGQVLIVDEFTGRTMPGRRWSEGLHQAVEAKEGVQVKGETQTLATITIQNYFRMYEKLAGMTGTAETEENEFHEIYGLAVVGHPDEPADRPRRPAGPRVQDASREVQRDRRGDAAPARAGLPGPRRHGERRGVRDARRACSRARGLKHYVLNAKYHQREAEIVAEAGQRRRDHDRDQHGRPRHRHQTRRRGHGFAPSQSRTPTARTIDVRRRCGGLHIIGSERHESRRIDRQLRGRAGRQGDPGRVAVLPVARRRPDAPVRLGAHRQADGSHGRAGWRGARRIRSSRAPSSRRRSASSCRTSSRASGCSSTTT